MSPDIRGEIPLDLRVSSALAAMGQQVRIGMEASGHAQWFERQLADLQFELWTGDAISPLRACPILHSTRNNFHEI